MFITAPIRDLLNKLVEAKIARRDKQGVFVATSKKSLVLMDHADILRFYNSKIRGILGHFSYAQNFSHLARVI